MENELNYFVFNYAEHIVVFLCILMGACFGCLIHRYRHKMDERKKKVFWKSLKFGCIVGLPLGAIIIWLFPELVIR